MGRLKNIPTLNDIRLTKRMNDEFKYDFTFYEKNNMMASRTTNTLSYNILLICHSIEKGMSIENPKFFGEEKIRRIMELTNMISDKDVYAYNIGMSTIKEYIEFGKKHKFLDNPIYDELSEYIKGKDFKKVPIGAHIVDKKEILKNKNDFHSILKNRHSVRKYDKKKIPDKLIEEIIELASNSPSACNRQMIKAYYVKSNEGKELIKKYGQGFSTFNTDNANFFVITFDLGAHHVIGERNQGYFNAGLFSMNLVNILHSYEIGACFVQFANSSQDEEYIKENLGIPQSERIAVFISFGYYEDKCTILYSDRKPVKDILKIV
jgi:nitroreductase